MVNIVFNIFLVDITFTYWIFLMKEKSLPFVSILDTFRANRRMLFVIIQDNLRCQFILSHIYMSLFECHYHRGDSISCTDHLFFLRICLVTLCSLLSPVWINVWGGNPLPFSLFKFSPKVAQISYNSQTCHKWPKMTELGVSWLIYSCETVEKV